MVVLILDTFCVKMEKWHPVPVAHPYTDTLMLFHVITFRTQFRNFFIFIVEISPSSQRKRGPEPAGQCTVNSTNCVVTQ